MENTFCRKCAGELHETAQSCPRCGVTRTEVDEMTALRLYFHSIAGIPPQLYGKESTCYEEFNIEILKVPCLLRFGFTSEKKYSTTAVTIACAWIFCRANQDFFGSIYLPVDKETQACSYLNLTIERAIEQAIHSQKFGFLFKSL